MVAELINPVSRWWDREFILRSFNREVVEAILRVPLSCRYTPDTLFWLVEKSGEYSVRTGYHVEQRLIKELDWAECSKGAVVGRVWKVLWKLKVLNKINVFGWRACCNILLTRVNLTKKRIIKDNRCEACITEIETGVHALWNCGVAHLQKCCGGHDDMLQLMEDLITRLSTDELELFLVQAWIIWHQRNTLIRGKQVQASGVLNKRAEDYMEEYRRAQTRLSINSTIQHPCNWRPPPSSRFKLNFDAAIFKEDDAIGMGAIIRNEKGEVMASLSAKGLLVTYSEEAEILACCRVIEFDMECGFLELVVEGDNQSVMDALKLKKNLSSQVGHIFQDVLCLLKGLRWSQVQFTRRSANTAAHALARHAKKCIS